MTELGEDPRASNSLFKIPTVYWPWPSSYPWKDNGEGADKCLVNKNLVAKGSLIFSDFSKSSLSSLMIVKYLIDDLGVLKGSRNSKDLLTPLPRFFLSFFIVFFQKGHGNSPTVLNNIVTFWAPLNYFFHYVSL